MMALLAVVYGQLIFSWIGLTIFPAEVALLPHAVKWLAPTKFWAASAALLMSAFAYALLWLLAAGAVLLWNMASLFVLYVVTDAQEVEGGTYSFWVLNTCLAGEAGVTLGLLSFLL